MGNDKQIKDSLEKSKSVFLPEIIENPDGKPVLYSLEDEYAKTKKNTPFLLYLFVAGFVLLIVVVSMIGISFSRSFSSKDKIDIKEFEDIKLKELIESSRKNENQIEKIRRDMGLLEEDYKLHVDKINQEFERLREGLMAREMPEAERNVQMSNISDDKKKKLKIAETEYSSKRKEKESEISKIEKKLREFGSSMLEKAKQAKDIFGGEGKLRNMEVNRVTSDYERKLREQKEADRREMEELILTYNPNFKEKNLQDILSKPVPEAKGKNQYFSGISDELAVENAISKDQLARLSDDMKKDILIKERLLQIPYKNSVQRSILHSDSLAKSIFSGYDSIMQKLVGSVQGKNLNLKYYNYAFEYMTKSQQESGYILDPRDRTKVGIYFGRTQKPRIGDYAYVFRTDDDYIATLKLKTQQGVLVGEVTDLAPKRDIRPFDKLMLKTEREKK